MTSMWPVLAGDVWRDNDKRHIEPREMRVITVGNDHAVMENTRTGRRTIIALSRFKPTSNGYVLVSRGGDPVRADESPEGGT